MKSADREREEEKELQGKKLQKDSLEPGDACKDIGVKQVGVAVHREQVGDLGGGENKDQLSKAKNGIVTGFWRHLVKKVEKESINEDRESYHRFKTFLAEVLTCPRSLVHRNWNRSA